MSGPAYWETPAGVLERYLDRDYMGDGLAARTIALGGAYDYVEVCEDGNFGTAGTHLWLARSWSDAEQNLAWKVGTAFNFAGGTNASCVTQWNGFENGRTEIKLGNNAGALTNLSGVAYKIRAWKYRTITP